MSKGAGQQLAKDGSEWFFTRGMRGEGAGTRGLAMCLCPGHTLVLVRSKKALNVNVFVSGPHIGSSALERKH